MEKKSSPPATARGEVSGRRRFRADTRYFSAAISNSNFPISVANRPVGRAIERTRPPVPKPRSNTTCESPPKAAPEVVGRPPKKGGGGIGKRHGNEGSDAPINLRLAGSGSRRVIPDVLKSEK